MFDEDEDDGTQSRGRFDQDDPVIRHIVRKRYIGALLCLAVVMLGALLRLWVGADSAVVVIPAVFMVLFMLDAFLIKGRVHAGYFGDNRMECEQVARAVSELRAEQNTQQNSER